VTRLYCLDAQVTSGFNKANPTLFFCVVQGKRHLFATFEMIALECWRDQDMSCFFVTDDNIWQRFKGSWVYDTTDKPPEQADTIEELADKLGLDRKELKRTVDEYNAAVDESKEFDLMKLDGKGTRGLHPNKTNW
jgi:hypothetical protein